jgi:hypothetical protein
MHRTNVPMTVVFIQRSDSSKRRHTGGSPMPSVFTLAAVGVVMEIGSIQSRFR